MPAVIAAALTLLAQVSTLPADKVSPKKEESVPTCQVTGRVVTAADGSPLKSARLALSPQAATRNSQFYGAFSDSDGHFVLKDIAPGRYQFLAVRAGYVDQHYKSQGSESGAVLDLKPGQKISDVVFRMTMAAVIIGRITNEDSEGMPGVRVVAMRKPTEDDEEDDEPYTSSKRELVPVTSAHTDDRGQYRLFGLKPGEYYVQAVDSLDPTYLGVADIALVLQQELGTDYAPVYYPGVSQSGQAQVITTKAGEEAEADFSMSRVKTAEVSGRVLGREGPARNTWVTLELAESNEYSVDRQATTDDSGNFTFKGVPPGSYVLLAYQRQDDLMVGQGHQKVEVAGENVEGLTVSLGGGARVEGRVVISGSGSTSADQITINLHPVKEDAGRGSYARVKKDLSFELDSVADGNYSVRVWGIEHGWYIKSVRCGAQDVLEKGLQVENGAADGKLEIVVSSTSAQLEGSVMDHDAPVIGARVHIVPDPKTPYNRFRSDSANTDQTGHFVITGLAAGKYRVVGRTGASQGGEVLKSEPQNVTLSEGEHKTIQLTVQPPAE